MDLFSDVVASASGGWSHLTLPAKVEACALASFVICLVGSSADFFNTDFDGTVGMVIALLALHASRTRREPQLLVYIGCALFSSVAEIIYIFSVASAWGVLFCLFNLILKGITCMGAFRLSQLAGADLVPATDDEGAAGYPSAAYVAPGLDQDYGLDSGAPPAGRGGGDGTVGPATQYRAI